MFIATTPNRSPYRRNAGYAQSRNPIVYKRHVADSWMRWAPQPLPNAACAWVGENGPTAAQGHRLALYATKVVNPHPEKEVESIVYAWTPNEACAPFCFGMTIEHEVSAVAVPSS